VQFAVGPVPSSLKSKIIVPFKENHLSLGRAHSKSKKVDIIYCSEPLCIKSFSSVDNMLRHLDYGKHEVGQTSASSMEKVKDNWVRRFCLDNDDRSTITNESFQTEKSRKCEVMLEMGWAIPKRSNRRLNDEQKSFLNRIFDEGEKKGCKETPETASAKIKETFTPKDYLPVSTIKSYFSRRAKKVRTGEVNIQEYTEEETMDMEETEEQQEDERSITVQVINDCFFLSNYH
jgi:hypothetical protein